MAAGERRDSRIADGERTADLVVLARSGDRNALTRLVEHHEHALARFCRRLVGRGAAEDLAQETLLRAVQALERLEDPARFSAWLFGIAANLARKWWERQKRWPLSLESLASAYPDVPWDAAPPLDRPDLVAEQVDHVRRLGQAMDSLPTALRRVLKLHYLDGLSYAEIAAALDVPLSTVRGRLFTSRTRLHRELAAAGVLPAARTARRRRASNSPRRAGESLVHQGGSHPMERVTIPAAARLVPVTIDRVSFYDPEWPDHLTPMTEADVRGAFNPISKHQDGAPLVHEEVVRVAERIAAMVNEAHLRIGQDLRVAVLKTMADSGEGAGAERYLPIVIGFPEAAAIVMQRRDLQPPRPLTHDLLCQALAALGARVSRVVVTDGGEYTVHYRASTYRLPMFRASLVLKASRRDVVLDTRPSDALAVAVRTGAPVFVEAPVLARYGFAANGGLERMAPFVGFMTGGFRFPPVPT